VRPAGLGQRVLAAGDRPQPAGPLSHLLLGAIDEGAMLIARADDDGRTREQVGASVERMLNALRVGR